MTNSRQPAGLVEILDEQLGKYRFIPTANFFGTTSFTFVANDGFGDSAEGTITIQVDPINDAPTLRVTNLTSTHSRFVDNKNRIFIEDFVVADVDVGPQTNNIILIGDDAALFEIIGNSVYLIANAGLDTHATSMLNVSLAVDDPELGSEPEVIVDISMALTNPPVGIPTPLPSSFVGFVNENLWLAQRDGAGDYNTTLATQTAFPDSKILRFFQGDFNGDLREDVAFLMVNGELYVGVATPDGHFSFSLWTTLRTTNVYSFEVGDFNGDGMTDVLGIYQAGILARIWVFESTGSQFLPDAYGTYLNYSGIATTLIGNFDGVHGDDLAIWNKKGVWWVGKTDPAGTSFRYGSAWDTWNANRTITNISIGDFNGDDMDDIFGVFNIPSEPDQRSFVVGLSEGDRFRSRVWRRATLNGSLDAVVIGDFNADQNDDFAILTNQQQWTVGLANVAKSRFGFEVWGTSSFSGTVQDFYVGDSNGDGRADIFVRDLLSRWQTVESNGSSFTTRWIQQWNSSSNWQHVSIGNFATAPSTDTSSKQSGTEDFEVFGSESFLDLLHTAV